MAESDLDSSCLKRNIKTSSKGRERLGCGSLEIVPPQPMDSSSGWGAITRIFIRHFLFPRRDYWRSANVNRQLPALTATYCLPPTEYVIGLEMTAAPRDVFHSSAPVRASKA